jgi:hypothetical protein
MLKYLRIFFIPILLFGLVICLFLSAPQEENREPQTRNVPKVSSKVPKAFSNDSTDSASPEEDISRISREDIPEIKRIIEYQQQWEGKPSGSKVFIDGEWVQLKYGKNVFHTGPEPRNFTPEERKRMDELNRLITAETTTAQERKRYSVERLKLINDIIVGQPLRTTIVQKIPPDVSREVMMRFEKLEMESFMEMLNKENKDRTETKLNRLIENGIFDRAELIADGVIDAEGRLIQSQSPHHHHHPTPDDTTHPSSTHGLGDFSDGHTASETVSQPPQVMDVTEPIPTDGLDRSQEWEWMRSGIESESEWEQLLQELEAKLKTYQGTATTPEQITPGATSPPKRRDVMLRDRTKQHRKVDKPPHRPRDTHPKAKSK